MDCVRCRQRIGRYKFYRTSPLTGGSVGPLCYTCSESIRREQEGHTRSTGDIGGYSGAVSVVTKKRGED